MTGTNKAAAPERTRKDELVAPVAEDAAARRWAPAWLSWPKPRVPDVGGETSAADAGPPGEPAACAVPAA